MGDNLYREACSILDAIVAKRGLARQLCFQSKFANKKLLLAVVCETVRYHPVLQQLIEASDLLKYERKLSEHMALVLVYDAILGTGIRCGGALKASIMKHKRRLDSELIKLKIRAGAKTASELLPADRQAEAPQPRYARINLILITKAKAIEEIISQGFSKVVAKTQADLLQLEKNAFAEDPHLEDLIVFAASTDLHDNTLYVSGKLILQDKASCFPASGLAPKPGDECMDACAAPGNKTSHLAALMNNTGNVYAFDADVRRMAILKRLTGKAGASCISTFTQNFLEADTTLPTFAKVTHVLVDPSCSGSGMTSVNNEMVSVSAATKAKAGKRKRKRQTSDNMPTTSFEETPSPMPNTPKNKNNKRNNKNHNKDNNTPHNSNNNDNPNANNDDNDDSSNAKGDGPVDEATRLSQLAQFQEQCVLKAMSFPAVEKVSYSTCSIHETENEQVVARVLAANTDFDVETVLPQWPRRGLDKYPFGAKVIRCDRQLDGTTGFFVALFKRKQPIKTITALASATANAHGITNNSTIQPLTTPSTINSTPSGDSSNASTAPKKQRKRKRHKKNKNTTTTLGGDVTNTHHDDAVRV
eukprot:m.13866 g.13866  ORF g.13866 m.13866 type:complete len:588 (-) comp9899_c0_seq1:179-1942(-)